VLFLLPRKLFKKTLNCNLKTWPTYSAIYFRATQGWRRPDGPFKAGILARWGEPHLKCGPISCPGGYPGRAEFLRFGIRGQVGS